MIAIISAGGQGKRMKNMCLDTPKPMLPICGKPILQRQIEHLKGEGITRFIISECYLPEIIEDYFGDGSKFGVIIEYIRESEPSGTGWAITKIKPTEDFLFCSGDLVFDFSLKDLLDFHLSKKALITLFSHPGNHPVDSLVLKADGEGRVSALTKGFENEYERNLCNAGVQIVSGEIFSFLQFGDYVDFDRDIVRPLLSTGRVYAYKSIEYVKDAGTPERFAEAENDIEKMIPSSRRKNVRHRAVFLDRDGTVNKYKGLISYPEDLELIDGVPEAINIFHRLGYLVIIITNQPVIAKGLCSLEELGRINNRLEFLLGSEGSYIDDLYFCPHHPEKGFPGENPEYKIKCDCRKPLPGMIIRAAGDYNIDLSSSFMAGDSLRDVECGLNSGCQPIYVRSGFGGDIIPAFVPSFDDILCFAEYLLINRSDPGCHTIS